MTALPAPTFSLDALTKSAGPAPTGQRASVPRRPHRPVRTAAPAPASIRPTNRRAIQGALRALVSEGHIPGAVGMRTIAEYAGVSVWTAHAAIRAGVAATVGLVFDDLAPADQAEAWEWKITDHALARVDAGECAPYWRDHGQTARAIWETLDASGPLRVKAVVAATCMSVRTVHRANGVLVALGAIVKVGHGTYQAVDGWDPWAQTPEQVTVSVSDGVDSWEYSGTRAECAAERHRADRLRVTDRWDEVVARLSADRLEREALDPEAVACGHVLAAREFDLISPTTRDRLIDAHGLTPRYGPPAPAADRLARWDAEMAGLLAPLLAETDAERCLCDVPHHDGGVWSCTVHFSF